MRLSLIHISMDTPIPQAERVVSAGKGIGEKKNMKLVESLAKAAGAAIGCLLYTSEKIMEGVGIH